MGKRHEFQDNGKTTTYVGLWFPGVGRMAITFEEDRFGVARPLIELVTLETHQVDVVDSTGFDRTLR